MSSQPDLNKFATELSKLVNKYSETPKSIACGQLYRTVRDLSDKFKNLLEAKDE